MISWFTRFPKRIQQAVIAADIAIRSKIHKNGFCATFLEKNHKETNNAIVAPCEAKPPSHTLNISAG